ncbi:MAG: hypothetical protein HWD90_06150 [Campylobacteraceae bacterium]|nr:hypothetical protein [Campylobacteraceae bacterium]
MKSKVEPERYFVVSEFEDGWGMEDIQCEEQLFSYCTEALFIPEELIEELNVNDAYNLEIVLSSIDLETVDEDWYVNLMKISKDS